MTCPLLTPSPRLLLCSMDTILPNKHLLHHWVEHQPCHKRIPLARVLHIDLTPRLKVHQPHSLYLDRTSVLTTRTSNHLAQPEIPAAMHHKASINQRLKTPTPAHGKEVPGTISNTRAPSHKCESGRARRNKEETAGIGRKNGGESSTDMDTAKLRTTVHIDENF